MNLRMFPVPSNHSRRLRRVAAASSSSMNMSDRPMGKSFSHELEPLRETYPFMNGSTYNHRFAYLKPSDRDMLLRQQAMDKAQAGDLDMAIALFTQLIRYNPNSASNFNNRGLLHFKQGQPEQALMDYHQALMLNPRLGKVYNNRANCFAALGNLEAAIADYETAIDLDPTDLRPRLNLGITLRQLEHYSDAIAHFDLALQCSQFLNTTDTVGVPAAVEGHLYAERGRTYHLIGDWNYAVADYQRALEHLPLSGSTLDVSSRLRAQVRNWMHQLLSPLQQERE